MRRDILRCPLFGITGAIALLVAQMAPAAPPARAVATGGTIRLIAMNGLETQSAANLDIAAIGMCHTMAKQGIKVSAVQIVTQAGQLIRQVRAATLLGC